MALRCSKTKTKYKNPRTSKTVRGILGENNFNHKTNHKKMKQLINKVVTNDNIAVTIVGLAAIAISACYFIMYVIKS